MLIVCIGPDGYRAVQRARQLEAAFREKHDPLGNAIEHLSPGKIGVDELIERASGANLFQPRRFLRVDGLLSGCPKAKRELLALTLKRDPERTIVVCVEEKPLDKDANKWLTSLTDVHVSEYPLLHGQAFQKWLLEQARGLHFTDDNAVARLAVECDGDSWAAMSELNRLAAGGVSERTRASDASHFDLVDRVVSGGATDRRSTVLKQGAELLNLLQYQYRALLRVLGGETQGIHPFVVKKLSRGKNGEGETRFAKSLAAVILTRSGLSKEEEIGLLLDDQAS